MSPADREATVSEDPRVKAVLAAWGLRQSRVESLGAGHINRTYLVRSEPDRFVLQWVSPLFSPLIHHDIEAITSRLETAGLVIPRLVPTSQGALWVTEASGDVWRLMTHVDGQTLLVADSAERCWQAGRLLGAFHRALWNFDYAFRHGRFGVHDTAKHLAALERALVEHRDHRRYRAVEPLARAILEAVARLAPPGDLPERIVHGDPKISNVLFDPDGKAVCLVDLDTLARMPVATELGDAFRSWCSPSGEEVEASFDLSFFEAGLAGWAEAAGDLPTPEERRAVPIMVELVAFELAARFLADALGECYFRWDPERFASAADHNLVRARSQLAVGQSVRRQRADLARIVRRVVG